MSALEEVMRRASRATMEEFGEVILRTTWYGGTFRLHRRHHGLMATHQFKGVGPSLILCPEWRLIVGDWIAMKHADLDGNTALVAHYHLTKEEAGVVIKTALDLGAVTEFFGL